MIRFERTTVEWVHSFCDAPKPINESFELWKMLDGDEVVMVLGFAIPSLIGWADLWIIPCNISLKVLRMRRALIKLLRTHYPMVSAHVQGADNERFARFFGFQPIRQVKLDGKTLMRMELV